MALEVFYAGEGAMAYVEMLEFNDINKGLDGDFGFFAMPTIEDDAAKGNQEKLFGAPEGMIVNPNSENVDVEIPYISRKSAEDCIRSKTYKLCNWSTYRRKYDSSAD